VTAGVVLRVGIVAEGPSDWLVLEAVMRGLEPNVEFVRLRPDQSPESTSAFGWRGVRSWCREYGPNLATFMTGVTSGVLHVLVIHVDCSMAHNENARRPCPPAADTADALRAVILNSWLGLPTHPPFLVITNPSLSTEAWVVAALDPPYRNLNDIECDDRVENELVARTLLRRKDGEVKKPARRYQPLADIVQRELATVRRYCSQADRFCGDFGGVAGDVARD